MKKVSLSFLAVLIFLNTKAQNASYQWAKGMSGSSTESGISVVADANQNVYSTGIFKGTVDFDPGSAIFNLTAAGVNNTVYVSKNDMNGNFVWSVKVGNTLNTNVNSIKLDNNNNVYVCGSFNGTVDFNPGMPLYNITSNGSEDGFLLKLDNAGNFVWVKTWGKTGLDRVKDFDINNNVINIVGEFVDTVDMNPNGGVYHLTSTYNTSTNNFSSDVFLVNLDINGNFSWATSFGGKESDRPSAVAIDVQHNIIIGGIFKDTADFDPSATVYNLYSTGNNNSFSSFICKLNPLGQFIWAKAFVGNNRVELFDLKTDANNNVISTGGFEHQGDFDPNVNTYTLTSNQTSFINGYLDIFISKLDSNGIFVFAKQIGGDKQDYGNCIAIDNQNKIYVSGTFEGWPNPIDFNPGSTVQNVSSSTQDAYILKLNETGDFQFVKTFVGANYGDASGIFVDNLLNIYTTGQFAGANTDFNPNAGTQNLNYSNGADIYICKLSQCNITDSTLNVQSCQSSYQYNNQTYTNSGSYTHTLTNSYGCDSIVTLNLQISSPTYAFVSQTVCNSLVWFAQTLNTSGTYTHTLVNAGGCDSIITLNLIVNNSTTATVNQTVCNSLVWFGQTLTTSGSYTHIMNNSSNCDSIITLNLTVNPSYTTNIVDSACDKYLWYGQNINASGTYYHTLSSTTNCDSNLVLNLLVTNIDSSVIVSSNMDTLKAKQNGASYQWVKCPAPYVILNGETNQIFTNASIGISYAVIITLNGCSDTSKCVSVGAESINELASGNFNLSPNPFSNKIELLLNKNYKKVNIELLNTMGQRVSKNIGLYGKEVQLDFPYLPNGTYFLKITTEDGVKTVKIVKAN